MNNLYNLWQTEFFEIMFLASRWRLTHTHFCQISVMNMEIIYKVSWIISAFVSYQKWSKLTLFKNLSKIYKSFSKFQLLTIFCLVIGENFLIPTFVKNYSGIWKSSSNKYPFDETRNCKTCLIMKDLSKI